MASRATPKSKALAAAASAAAGNSPSSSSNTSSSRSRHIPEVVYENHSSPVSSSARSQSQLSYAENVPSGLDRLKENVTVTVRFRPLRFCFLRRHLSSSSACVLLMEFRVVLKFILVRGRSGKEMKWHGMQMAIQS